MPQLSIPALLLVLASAPEPDWFSKDLVTQTVTFGRYQTPPESWSKDGGFGLKWGMGPGDVRKHLPGVENVFSDSVPGYQRTSFRHTVEDLPVTVLMTFHRGRLFKVDINSLNVGDLSVADADYEQKRMEFWKRAARWRKAITQILLDKYGVPERSPSARALQCAEPRAFCHADQEKEYVWRSGVTVITLEVSPVPTLAYVEPNEERAYREALGAAIGRMKTDEVERRQRERDRL